MNLKVGQYQHDIIINEQAYFALRLSGDISMRFWRVAWNGGDGKAGVKGNYVIRVNNRHAPPFPLEALARASSRDLRLIEDL